MNSEATRGDARHPMEPVAIRAAVVGTGVVGLAAAAGLARAGCRVLVFGEQPEVYERSEVRDLRVLAVNRGSQLFLEDLGAWEAIAAEQPFAYRAMSVWSGDGRVNFDADDVGDVGCGEALGHIVENSLARSALFEQLSCADRVELRCPAMVSDVRRSGDSMTVTTDDGIEETEETVDLVVGADGANSRVRTLMRMDADTAYTDYNQSAVVATLSVPAEEGGYCRQRFFDEGVLAFLPSDVSLDRATVSIVWSCDNAVADELRGLSPERFAHRVARAFGMDDERAAKVTLLSERAAFPVRGVFVQTRVRRGVALVGDAAHAVHPMAGLGANAGLADARSLSHLVGARQSVEPSVLRAYMSEATERALMLRRFLDALNMLFAPHSPVAVAALREAGLNGVNCSRHLKAWFARRAAFLL